MLHTLDITPEPHEANALRCSTQATHPAAAQAAPRFSRKPGIAQSTPKHQMADARSPRQKRGRDAPARRQPAAAAPPPKNRTRSTERRSAPFYYACSVKETATIRSTTTVRRASQNAKNYSSIVARLYTKQTHRLSKARAERREEAAVPRLSFAVVYPDKKGQTAMKEVGVNLVDEHRAICPRSGTEDVEGPPLPDGRLHRLRDPLPEDQRARGPVCGAVGPARATGVARRGRVFSYPRDLRAICEFGFARPRRRGVHTPPPRANAPLAGFRVSYQRLVARPGRCPGSRTSQIRSHLSARVSIQ